MNKTEQTQRDDLVNWRVIAYALAGCSWAVVFALLIWLCSSVSDLKQDMAVVKNILHTQNESASR